jgi:hypothetical protein
MEGYGAEGLHVWRIISWHILPVLSAAMSFLYYQLAYPSCIISWHILSRAFQMS